MRVWFNLPSYEFVAEDTLGGDLTYKTVTVTTSDPSGFPAKNRGLYFDGTNIAYVTLTQIVIDNKFVIEVWIYP